MCHPPKARFDLESAAAKAGRRGLGAKVSNPDVLIRDRLDEV